ncbi:DUF5133 domain-containing protein [Streptomyces sp. NPDC094149]|uniref:DUF5133 domain-containing protein n=1 Tax=Streptomyces sp. NPDC094149 TaxID=3155079 RepID=UPI00331D17AA
MLVADPKAVRTLLTRYASLRIAQAERSTPRTTRELADVSRRLCAMTGTTDVREAIERADALLGAARRMRGGSGCGEDCVSHAA